MGNAAADETPRGAKRLRRPQRAEPACRHRSAGSGKACRAATHDCNISGSLRTAKSGRYRCPRIRNAATVPRIVNPGAAGEGRVARLEAAKGGIVDDDATTGPIEPTPAPKRTERHQLDRRTEVDPYSRRVGKTDGNREHVRRISRLPPAAVNEFRVVNRNANFSGLSRQNRDLIATGLDCAVAL